MINSDLNVGGIHRALIISVNGDVRIYVPGLTSLIAGTGSIINTNGTVNIESYNENKETLPRPVWCLPNLEAKQHDEVHPCWVTFENGDSKRPIIMGFLGKGIKYHAGGSGSSINIGTSDIGSSNISIIGLTKKVLIVPGHSTIDLYSANTPNCETNFGTFIYTNEARSKDGECTYTRKTSQAMYNYIEQNSPGLSELYTNINDYEKSLFNDIFKKEISNGFFNKYQAIVEIHYNSGGNGMFLKDDQITDTNVISIGKEMSQHLSNNGYSAQSCVTTNTYKNKCLVTQRCSILDGNQAYYYMETKNMDLGVSENDCTKIGELLGEIICKHYKVTSVSDVLTSVANYALSLVDKNVSYSQDNRTLNYNSDIPTSLDCSSFVYWCYMKAGLLPSSQSPYATPEFWTSRYFQRMAGPNEDDCKKFVNEGKLQVGDVLLRSENNSFGYGNSSHALIVAPGSYNNVNFNFVNCGGSSPGVGFASVKGTNDFFYDPDNKFFGVLRYKGK